MSILTFSFNVKQELLNKFPKYYKEAMSEFIGIFVMLGSISFGLKEKITFKILVENKEFVEYIEKLFSSFFEGKFDLHLKKFEFLVRGNLYVLEFFGDDIYNFLEHLGMLKFKDSYININFKPDYEKVVKKSFLKGVFLSSGNISNPEKGYHLEFIINSYNISFCNYFNNFLFLQEVKGKIIKRKYYYVVYIKESDSISRILNMIGAHEALLDFENIRVAKEYSNNKNRVKNCIEANEDKLIITSVRQVRAIMFIECKIGLDKLPKNLRDIAEIRLKYKEMSLKELGKFLNPPIGKSGVSHRLKKIEQIATQLIDKNL